MSAQESAPGARPALSPGLKSALEFGPLLLFFGAYWKFDLFVATAVFMAASSVSVGWLWWAERKPPTAPLATLAIGLVFGGLTLALQDETFIKMKPTMVYLLFAVILGGGLALGRVLLRSLFGQAFALTDAGWRRLTLNWIGFFLGMACLNEIVWRSVDTDMWVSFKTFGALPLTFIFALAQAPLIKRYAAEPRD